MVGICGIIGDPQHDIDEISHTIEWGDDETTVDYYDDALQLHTAVHHEINAQQPAMVENEDYLLWVWGDIIGFEDSSTYTPRSQDEAPDAEYCAELFESYGMEFVDGLNSEFAGMVFDRNRNEAILFTDRLGARPIYLTEDVEDNIIFSTNINTIISHPGFSPTLNEDLFSEFCKFERVFGTYTPFNGIRQLHPGSKLFCDIDGGETSLEKYWIPEYKPGEEKYSSRVEEFSTIIRKAVEERRDISAEEGLFISGGSDSRLLLSMFEDRNVKGYHLNESMNTEATIAKEVCDTLDVDFQLLQRDQGYLTAVLERVANHQIFTSFFDQAHFVGFEHKLKSEVDSVFSGHTADTILEGFYMPTMELSIPWLDWTVPLPIREPIADTRGYAEYITHSYQYNRGSSTDRQPRYLNNGKKPSEVLRNYMSESNGGVTHHGVTYPSLKSLSLSGGYYPLTNNKAYFTYYSTNQMLPTHYPFLDNRVIDFSLSIPLPNHVRQSIVNRTIRKQNKPLAEIPKSGIGLPLTYPRYVYSVAQLLRSFKRKISPPSSPHSGSWSNHGDVLRKTDIADKYLLDNDCARDQPDLIDWPEVEQTYQNHLRGENNYFDLYALISLCNSPFFSSRYSTSNKR